ncbi:LOW QUALITY PROTEIN: hypothetical protein U9M48_021937 [Paspalum notatum var. saurae]|uniref:Uncharacterized protein n=1 Tax=Paspalum notatum var. saurae TaxID=547442 RepID=A0AAQ3TLQ8_PASNO
MRINRRLQKQSPISNNKIRHNPVMAEMVGSAVIQEAVSRGVSFMLGKRKKASQGHMIERLEFALERSAKLPITDISLIHRRKMVKCAYIEAAELLDKHKQPPMQGQEEITQGLKHKRPWIFRPKNFSFSSSASLKMGDVQRLEYDCAGKFVRDVESSCSLRHYNFCNPIAPPSRENPLVQNGARRPATRYLHKAHIFRGAWRRGNARIWLRGSHNARKNFRSVFDHATEVAIEGLHLLTSQFKLAAESAMGELAMLASNLQDIAQSNVPLLSVGNRVQEWHVEHTQLCRPDPTWCKAFRHGHSANNIVSSELSHIFPEQVIYLAFHGYISKY